MDVSKETFELMKAYYKLRGSLDELGGIQTEKESVVLGYITSRLTDAKDARNYLNGALSKEAKELIGFNKLEEELFKFENVHINL